MTTPRRALLVLAALSLPGLGQTPTPLTRTDLTTDIGGSNDIAALDCNADGVADLVTSNRAGTFSIFIGNADGTFQSKAKTILFAAPSSVAAGDLDGDDKPDLAFAAGSAIILGTGAGSCNFTLSAPIPGPATLGLIRIADVSGDGKRDIVVNEANGAIRTLLGNGNGTFQAPQASTVGAAAGFAIGDLNNDGKPDIAATDLNAAGVRIGIGDGAGRFLNPFLVSTGTGPLVTLGDLNGDGKLDLITSSFFTNRVIIHLNTTPTAGVAPTFSSPFTINLPSGSGPGNPAVTPSPGSGKQDQLLVPNFSASGVAVFPYLSSQLLKTTGLDVPFAPAATVHPTSSNPVTALPFGNGGVAAPNQQGLTVLQPNCPLDVLPPNLYFGRIPPVLSPGQYVEVIVPDGCPWTATVTLDGNPADHITVTPLSGVGSQTVLVQITANPGAARNVRITFLSGNSSKFTFVYQAANTSTCGDPSVDRSSVSIGAQGGTASVTATVTSAPADQCSSSAATTDPSVTVSPGTVTNTGPVTFAVPPNSGDTKTIYGTIGANLIPITIAGSCTPALGSFNGIVPATGGTIQVPLTIPSGCTTTPKRAGVATSATVNGNNVSVTVPGTTATSPLTATVTIGSQIAQFIQKPPNPAQLFTDVPLTHPLVDYITMLKKLNITSGCTTTTYCPDDAVTRGQMAVFIVRSVESGDFFPYNPTPYFQDVPVTHPFFKYIQRLKDLGITAGCSAAGYCPDAPVTRGQMAVFLMRGRLGVPAGVPISFPGDQYFTDAPSTNGFYSYIQQMKALGITSGCNATQYCPDAPVTRGQMAVFLIRNFFTPYAK